MNIAGLDLATTSGLCVLKDGEFTAETYRGQVKKKFLDHEKGLDADREGQIGRQFQDYLRIWLITNKVGICAIEAPIASNSTRRKAEVHTDTAWAGKAITYTEVPGTSLAAIFRIYGLEFLAATICSRLNIPVRFISQGEWGKAFTGSGAPAGRKDRAVQQCRRLNIPITSVDAAESVGICWTLNQILNPYSHRRANDLFAEKPMTNAQRQIQEAEKLFKARA